MIKNLNGVKCKNKCYGGPEKKKKEETSRLWNDSIKTAIR